MKTGGSDSGPEEATTEYAAQAEPGDAPETGYVRGDEASDEDVPVDDTDQP
jgi:hypothetical protein